MRTAGIAAKQQPPSTSADTVTTCRLTQLGLSLLRPLPHHQVHNYTERQAANLFAQVVSAISYLHNLNLMHRDIKPENVMFTAPVNDCEAAGAPLRVKVIDLGMSAQFDPKKVMHLGPSCCNELL